MEISSKKLGRITGIFYFLIILGGLYGSMVARGSIINPLDEGATLENLIANESSYRIGFMGDLIMVISDVMVSLLFYYLLRPVSNVIAIFAAAFRLLQSTVLGANLINLYKPLILIEGATGLDSGEMSRLASDVMIQLSSFDYGYLISGVFFSINCFLMAYLLRKSDFFPGIFGIMIFLAAIGYSLNWLANFLIPSFIEASEMIMLFTAVIAELALCLYLRIKGTQKDEALNLT